MASKKSSDEKQGDAGPRYRVVSGAGVFGKGRVITRAEVEDQAKAREMDFDLDRWIEAGSVEEVK